MTLEQYTLEIKTKILAQFKNINEVEVDNGINVNRNFIKSCHDAGFSVEHVVHELTL